MTDLLASPSRVVLVTGANGLVGARVCAALAERGASVRALVRRAGTAPVLGGVEEVVGDLTDDAVATDAVAGVDAVVSTVHPMGSDRDAQHRVGVTGTAGLARAAADAGAEMFVHVSTAAVYDRSPGTRDVDEQSPLVGDDAGDYPVTKRDAEAAIADVDGITRVLVRPPAVVGSSDTSVWNTLRPAAARDGEDGRHAAADASWPWVHVDDLAALVADVVTGHVTLAPDPDDGPVPGACTPVDACNGTATWRDYLGAVTDALGVEPRWDDEPAWTGRITADRARRWGWTPRVELADALAEIARDTRSAG
jgi:nucleoside-diphosphate-sugar epimerase